MLKKYLFTVYSLLLSVVLFAQESDRTRPERFNSPDPNRSDLTPGGAPIDNYIYLLLGLAVLFIVYFTLKSRNSAKKA